MSTPEQPLHTTVTDQSDFQPNTATVSERNALVTNNMKAEFLLTILVVGVSFGAGNIQGYCHFFELSMQLKLINIGYDEVLRCDIRERCGVGSWRLSTIYTDDNEISLSQENCSACGEHFTVFNNQTGTYLYIKNIISELSGLYMCISESCSIGTRPSPSECFNVTAKAEELPQCPMSVQVNENVGHTFYETSSHLSVQVGSSLRFKCLEGSKVKSKCDVMVTEKIPIVTFSHNNCRLRCKKSFDNDFECKTDVYLNVTRQTTTPSLPGETFIAGTSHSPGKDADLSAPVAFMTVSVLLAIFLIIIIILSVIVCHKSGISRPVTDVNSPKTSEPVYMQMMRSTQRS